MKSENKPLQQIAQGSHIIFIHTLFDTRFLESLSGHRFNVYMHAIVYIIKIPR
jgi:hypothetical protein